VKGGPEAKAQSPEVPIGQRDAPPWNKAYLRAENNNFGAKLHQKKPHRLPLLNIRARAAAFKYRPSIPAQLRQRKRKRKASCCCPRKAPKHWPGRQGGGKGVNNLG